MYILSVKQKGEKKKAIRMQNISSVEAFAVNHEKQKC
jgi:hypothetical protein